MVSKLAWLKSFTSSLCALWLSVHRFIWFWSLARGWLQLNEMKYPYIVTKRKIKVAVIDFWVFSFMPQGFKYFSNHVIVRVTYNLIVPLAMTFCILVFITSTYAILYLESRRHESKIKAQQLPQEGVYKVVKENKAVKTTAFVLSAVLLSFPGSNGGAKTCWTTVCLIFLIWMF